MKSEDRHQLEQNDLAEWMKQAVEITQPYLWHIVIVVVLVVGGLTGSAYFSRTSSAHVSDGWQDMLRIVRDPQSTATDRAKGLQEVAKAYKDTPVAAYSTKFAADLLYEQAKATLLTDQSKARSNLDDALNQYKSLSTGPGVPVEVARQAALSLGMVEETMDALGNAKKSYEHVVNTYPETHAARVATAALERIKSTNAREFYGQLASYKAPANPFDSQGTPLLPPPLMENDTSLTPPAPPAAVIPDPPAAKSTVDNADDGPPANGAEGEPAGKETIKPADNTKTKEKASTKDN